MVSINIAIAIVLIVLFVLLLIETPIAFALAASGVVGIVLIRGFDVATTTLGGVPFNATNNYSLVIIPMYVLLGMFALGGELSKHLYSLASHLLRWLPGGLGVATVVACAGFAAISGSSMATVATIGKVSTVEMRKYGYPAALAGGIVATAGTLGILIPPSILLVMYAIMADLSIGSMLIAGIIPGLLIALAFAIYVVIAVKQLEMKQKLDEAGSSAVKILNTEKVLSAVGSSRTEGTPPRALEAPDVKLSPSTDVTEAANSSTSAQIRALVWIALIVTAVLAGMFTGVFTVIESAAIGAALALLMMVIETKINKRGKTLGRIWEAGRSAVGVTAMVFSMVIGAHILTQFLVMTRVPTSFATYITGLGIPSWLIVALFIVILIPLGMFLESMSIILIVVPIMAPIVTQLGFDPIWFGILFVIMLELGLVTPPVGMNVFVTSTTSGIPIEKLFIGVLPFVIVLLLVVAVLFLFPGIITWLPSLLS